MTTTTTPNFSSVLAQSGKFALQWRLLILWIVILLIPTAVMTMPLWHVISSQLNNSVHASELAHHLTMNAIYDVVGAMFVNKLMMHQALMDSVVLTLLLSPFLNGAIVTAARSTTPLAMGKLVHGGIAEYWRMFRMVVWAIIPFGIAGAITMGMMHWSDGVAEKAILQSDADFASNVTMIIMIVLLIIADASVDAGRAQFVHSTVRRSAIKAGWTGLMMVLKRPVTTLGVYVVITLIGFILAAVFGLLRKNVGDISGVGFVIGLILTQLIVAATAWMKIARLYALAAVSKQ
jgi:hypothetical protein